MFKKFGKGKIENQTISKINLVMHPDLKDILFIDIETVSCVDQYEKLNERLKTQWARKASFFKKEDGKTDEDLFHDRAAIYAEFGKIVVIGAGIYFEDEKEEVGLRVKSLADDNEKKLLLDFKSMLDKMGATARLCAHNGKEFDFPYLCRRMLVNEVALPEALNMAGKKPWDINHIDTMELWKFGDYNTILRSICSAPSLTSPAAKTTWTAAW
jgi:3'-5' exonuclease